jgi:putative copper resistance protein D
LLRTLVLFVHLTAAVFWIGEIMFLSLVAAPYGRRLPDPQAGAVLLQGLGRRSLPLVWLAVALLLATGVGNLLLAGLGPALATPAFWRGGFGRLLAAKLAVVAVMVTLAAWHDFVIAHRLRDLRRRLGGAAAADRSRLLAAYDRWARRARVVGRINLGLAVTVLLLAAGLITEGT